MKTLIIAWRNLWRNKRRTLITAASVFFGVLLSTLMSSMQDGTYGNMIEMMVKLSSGYLQVQHPEYENQQSINNTFEVNNELLAQITGVKEVTHVVKRLESFGLMSSGAKTRGGAIIGFEPEKDHATSNLQNWLHEGSFLESGEDGILLSYNTADYLGARLNDTIVLLSQGYHGTTAANVFPVKGILKFTTPQMNNLGAFMDIQRAQEFFSAYGRVTCLQIMVDDYTSVKPAGNELKTRLGDNYKVLNWQELQPEIVQFIESDKAGGVVMKGILYMVIGFGILGTIIMMIAERKREMGVMVAIGMQRYKLSAVLFFETLYIGLIGVVSGFLVSVPIVYLMVNNPIHLPEELGKVYVQYGFEPYLFFGTAPEVFLNQVITVFILTLLVSVYPIVNSFKMNVTNALRA